jgi:hypothetical protein
MTVTSGPAAGCQHLSDERSGSAKQSHPTGFPVPRRDPRNPAEKGPNGDVRVSRFDPTVRVHRLLMMSRLRSVET